MKAFKITFILLIILLSFPTYTMAYSATYCKFIKGNDDFTQFHIAACKGDVEAVKKFIGKGINVNRYYSVNAQLRGINERYEFNALHTALMQYRDANEKKDNYRQIIELLVKNGINADKPFLHTKKQAKLEEPHDEMEASRPITFAPNNEIAELLRKGGAKMSPLIFSHSDEDHSGNFYKGIITVSGTIKIYPDDDQWLPGTLCMDVDEDTSDLIPRINDSRAAWFCLGSDKTLFAKMKIDGKKIKTKCFTGFAKIQITNYVQYTGGSEGFDSAKLVKVIETRDYSYKKCQDSE